MTSHDPRNVLVTGAAGFIGSNFVQRLALRHSGAFVLLDSLTYAGNLANLAGVLQRQHTTFVHGDICDEELLARIFLDHRIDTVVHFAAESHVDRSIRGPDEFIRSNVLGTHALLKAARTAWEGATSGCRFHHVSTDEVYGSLDAGSPAATENTVYSPNSPYAASKAAADHLVRAYSRTFGLPAVTTNCSNNFGPFQFPEKLISLAIVRALLGEPIPVYGDGGQVRDWLYVADHCAAVDLVLRAGRSGETYNVAGSGGLTNLEVLRRLCDSVDDLLRREPTIAERFPAAPACNGARASDLLTYVPDRPGHDRRYALDDTKLRRELRFAAETSLGRGLELTIRWYADNELWWRAVMDGSYRDWISTQYGALAAQSA